MSEPPQPPAPLPAEPQYPAASPRANCQEHSAPSSGTHTFPAFASSGPPHPAATPSPAAPTPPTAAPAYPTAHPTATVSHPTGAPGYPASWPTAPGSPTTAAVSSLGRTAFVIAVVALAVNLISSIVQLLVYTSDFGYGSAYAIDEAIGVISLFAYVVALVLGIIAARRPGPRLLAGIAIGIAGAGALGMIFSWIGIAFLRFV